MSNRSPNSVKGSSRNPVYRHTRLRYIWRSHTQRPPTVRLGHTTNICVQGRSTWTMVPLGNGGKRGIGGNSWPMSCPLQLKPCSVGFIMEFKHTLTHKTPTRMWPLGSDIVPAPLDAICPATIGHHASVLEMIRGRDADHMPAKRCTHYNTNFLCCAWVQVKQSPRIL